MVGAPGWGWGQCGEKKGGVTTSKASPRRLICPDDCTNYSQDRKSTREKVNPQSYETSKDSNEKEYQGKSNGVDNCFLFPSFLILTPQQTETDVVNVAVVEMTVAMIVRLQGVQESRSCPFERRPYLVT